MHFAHGRRRLIQGATLATLLVLLQACTGRPSGPANVLIVTLDTLRADRIGAYGYAAARTPVLDGLAARGARFANATTTTPLTLAAHTSLFTGTFPTYHGVRDNTGFYVDDSLQTLAETLKARGYRTAGFVGAFVLDGRWGIAQGFDEYVDDFDLGEDVGPGLDAIQRRGSEVVDKAAGWLHGVGDQPFFGWVHLYDPHTPYDAPAEFASRFPDTRDGAYDAEIAYTDSQVGRLLAALETAGHLDDTLVVVLADHGEQLGEHDEQAHGFFVYDASVQVPLIMAGPGVTPRVVPDQVRIVDVMPTVLDLLQVPGPAPMQGTSLGPTLAGERVDLLAFAESWYPRFHYGWSELRAVRDGRFKFILAPTARALRHRARPWGDDESGVLGCLACRRARAVVARADGPNGRHRRRRGSAGRRRRRRAEAARPRLRRQRPQREEPRGEAAARSQGHDRALQPAAPGRRGLGVGTLRCRRREGATGVGRRPRDHRGLFPAGEHPHQGRQTRGGHHGLPGRAGARSDAPAVDLQPRAGLPDARPAAGRHRRLRTHAGTRPA